MIITTSSLLFRLPALAPKVENFTSPGNRMRLLCTICLAFFFLLLLSVAFVWEFDQTSVMIKRGAGSETVLFPNNVNATARKLLASAAVRDVGDGSGDYGGNEGSGESGGDGGNDSGDNGSEGEGGGDGANGSGDDGGDGATGGDGGNGTGENGGDGSGGNGGDGSMNRTGGRPCSKDDIAIFQGPTSPLPNGIPTYTVQILNACVAGYSISNIHVSCGWFSSARLINPRVFRRLCYDDCLVNDGNALGPGEGLSFQYANTFQYPLQVASLTC